MKSSINIDKILPWLGIAGSIAVWEAGTRFFHAPAWILPSPVQVFGSLLSSFSLISHHAGHTLLEAGLGYLSSIVLAVLFALLFALSPFLKRVLYPLLILSQTIPLITLAVLFTIWFGWGMLPKVLVVILVCFFPISISLINGINSVDIDQVKLFSSMGARPFTIFRMVEFPLALPSLFAGLRISATYSVMAAVIAEWMGAQRGLGYFMTIQQKSFAIDRVLAAVIVICVISLLMVKLVDLAEYLFIPWNRAQNRLTLWN